LSIFYAIKFSAFNPTFAPSIKPTRLPTCVPSPSPTLFPQTKLVYCLAGCVLDVAVDLREESPDFGRWYSVELSSENNLALYIPGGFAHGFQALEDNSVVYYKCSSYYMPENDRSMLYNSVDIDWRDLPQIVSDKDKAGKPFDTCDKYTYKDFSFLKAN
jgi:dTDP-4-dehydrorhamnose 3,5-epimerase